MSTRHSGRALALASLMACLAFLLYRPALDCGFVDYDDGAYVTKNPEVAAGLTLHGLRWAFLSSHSSNWHPLTWLSHMLDVELFGLDAGAHHRTNVLLFAASAALCLLAFHRLTGRLLASLAIAALFVAHPLRVESVAWVAERKDVLSGLFFFLVLLAHGARVEAPTRTAARRASVATLVFLALGLLAKQMLVTVPLLLWVLDLGPLRRRERPTPPEHAGGPPAPPPTARALALEKLPMLALCLAAGVATVVAQRLGGAVRSFESIPVAVRLSNAVSAYGEYLVKALHPTDLAVFYPHPWLVTPDAYSILGTRFWVSLAALLALSAGALLARRRSPWLLAGWLWYLGMALPVIGIVQVGAQWIADRYAYLPHVGLYAGLVLGLGECLRSSRARHVPAALALAAAIALVPFTRAQLATWHDTRTLFQHALTTTQHNWLAHVNLGYIDHREGRLEEAEAHYRAALEDAPRMSDALTNLAGIELADGRLEDARRRLDQVLAQDPAFENAWLLYGVLEEQAGRPGEALARRERALELDPDSPAAAASVAGSLLALGRAAQARALLEPLARAHPNHAELQVALARAEAALGQDGAAVSRLERLEARGDATGRAELAWLLATTPDAGLRAPARALELARSLERPDWRGLRALAAALYVSGDVAGARSALLDAAASAPKRETAALMDLRRRMERRQPLR